MTDFTNEYTWGKAVSDNSEEKFHSNFDNAIEKTKKEFNQKYPAIINGKEVFSDEYFQVKSPANREITVAEFPQCSTKDVLDAITSAKNSFEEWSTTSYRERIRVFRECADDFSKDKFHLAAIMTFENGKNRVESMNDVDEAIDFMRFYALQLEKNEGFCKPTPHPNPKEKTRVVMRPFGVWGIIAPFNFPSAIAIGMTTAALLTGNTAVLKPSSDAPLSSYHFVKNIYSRIPNGAINFVTGPGSIVGNALIESRDVSGIAFTGSYHVGMSGFKKFTENTAKPFISEMGGKNPVIVTKNANLDNAAEGVMKAAFGYGGQKCSACSRVYVQEDVAEQFTKKLVEKTKKLKIGMPWEKEVFLGPIINESAKNKFDDAVSIAQKEGKILSGGSVMQKSELKNGYFVEPTIVSNLSDDSKLVKEELFLPFVCIQKFKDFDEAIKKANDTEYGLTAGIFSDDESQVETFFDKIHAGVVYANRTASATTAALVFAQPFGGWKNSGTTGKSAGGENYLQQFMRSQTQTRCD
ncbi:aldehyde dehydrogenase family protein [Nitrosopumilus sp. S4]